MTDIGGFAKPGFEAAEEAFRANFDVHGEVGAAFCLYVRGEPVVDLWGGVADVESGRLVRWVQDSGDSDSRLAIGPLGDPTRDHRYL